MNPVLPKAKFAGGKVIQGPAGAMRTYRFGGRAFLVLSGEGESDVVLGVNHLALQAKAEVAFATDPAGKGLVMVDAYGRVVRRRGVPARYTWEELRALGKQAIIPREKWTAQRPQLGKLNAQTNPYSMITLHHTGSRDTPQAVLDLHSGNISEAEKWLRRIGRQLGQSQTYDDYGDIGCHFLIDEDGRIYEGRPLNYEGAHVSGHNPGNLGIAVLGDYSSKPLNAAQLRALESLIKMLGPRLGILPVAGGGGIANSGFVYGHGDFDREKHDELAGARAQLDHLMRRLQPPYRGR